jgi:hypothetical protein
LLALLLWLPLLCLAALSFALAAIALLPAAAAGAVSACLGSFYAFVDCYLSCNGTIVALHYFSLFTCCFSLTLLFNTVNNFFARSLHPGHAKIFSRSVAELIWCYAFDGSVVIVAARCSLILRSSSDFARVRALQLSV